MKRFKLLFLLAILISMMATNALSAEMPTDISAYSPLTNFLNWGMWPEEYVENIPVHYLAWDKDPWGTFGTVRNKAILSSPSGREYVCIRLIEGINYGGLQKCKVEKGGYEFFDLQKIEKGTWGVRLIEEKAGKWYYAQDKVTATYEESTNTLIIQGDGQMIDYSRDQKAPWNITGNPYQKTDIQSIIIEDGVTYIGSEAFSGCTDLYSVTFGKDIKSVGSGAFNNCSNVKKVITSDINTWCGIDFANATANPLNYAKKLYKDKNTEITELVIPDKVTHIGSYAFYGCTGLTSVTIGNGVTSIGNYAFEGCSGLTSVTIGNGVTNIGNYAFSGCSGLTSITIPNSVASIADNSFGGCSSLTSVIFHCSHIGLWFSGNTFIKNVTIGNEVTSIEKGAFNDCTGIQKVIVPDIAAWCGIDFADGYANPLFIAKHLYNTDNIEITTLEIPETVTSIGNYAFYGCSGLTSVTIPNSVTSIGGYAFSGCSGLESITIGNSVTSIGDGAFSLCSSLTSVTIPNSVTSIGIAAFYGCSGLTSVTIPNSVTSIGGYAFSGCSGLTSVAFHCKEIGTWFRGSTSIKEVTIGEEVTSIGDEAFRGCSGLTSVTIGNGVTSIAQQAFAGCSGLQKVYSKVEDVFGINKNTFDTNTYNNAKLYVPVGKKAVYEDTPWWLSFTNIEEYDYSTGIAAQQMGKDVKVVDAYQLNGLKRNGVQRGLNIVRMSDGTTRKVVVK